MKITFHKKPQKRTNTYPTYNPLIVWLTKWAELHIERGDSLEAVAITVGSVLKIRSPKAMRLGNYYFNLGERLRDRRMEKDWTPEEQTKTPRKARRYLKTKKRRN